MLLLEQGAIQMDLRLRLLIAGVFIFSGCFGPIGPVAEEAVSDDAFGGGAGSGSEAEGSGDGDADGDGIPDSVEGQGDPDGDGQANSNDTDSDGDGIPDSVEGAVDSDGDGIPDFLDLDSDGDGILDGDEGWDDIDGDGIPNYLDEDSDGDGVGDNVDPDFDGDGLNNSDENSGDSDGDGVTDWADPDSDNDGVLDGDEEGTDPTNPDSDGDGWTDLQEDLCGSDPTDPLDSCDGQSITVYGHEVQDIVVTYDTQIQLGDVMFILDETCSMTGTLDDVTNNFEQVVAEVGALIPDLTFGVASFDDYNYGEMGSGTDKPYHARQQQTSDLALAQQALASLTADGGDDWSESTIEALYQAASGLGYDQNCDGSFDPATDVLPFTPFPGDAFGGAAPGTASGTVQGTGTKGGNGFREGAVPILVYATDATMRNALPPYGEGPRGSVPSPGCSTDAVPPMLEAALDAIDAKAIGVAAGTTDAVPAMQQVAQFTDSFLDLNADGATSTDELMVYNSTGYDIVSQVVTGIEEFTSNVTYDLSMEVEDPTGAVANVSPAAYFDVPALNTVDFTVTIEPDAGTLATMFSDTAFVVPTTLYGDGSVILGQWDLVFLVTVTPSTTP